MKVAVASVLYVLAVIGALVWGFTQPQLCAMMIGVVGALSLAYGYVVGKTSR